MQYRKFGKLGIEVSAFGVGCMRFPMIKLEDGTDAVDESVSTPVIRHAIDNGVNYIDTAYVYSNQKNETAVGHALRDGYREKVYLATKLPTWMCNTREDMDKYLDEQLARLETDCIDFYLVHALNKGTWEKIRDLGAEFVAVDALAAALEAGDARAVNVVLLGLLSTRLPFPEEVWQDALAACVKPRFLEMNRKAFALGRALQ